jgi:hypothetical protein
VVARRALKEAPQQPRSGRGGRNGSVPVYSEELAEEICDRLARGESLYAICKMAGMPSEAGVRKWVETRADFGARYAHAREFGFDSIAEQVMALSDQDFVGPDGFVDNGKVQAARLQTDSRRWFLSKLMPKRYGDKVTQEITGEDGGALISRIELIPVPPRPRPEIEHESADKPGKKR